MIPTFVVATALSCVIGFAFWAGIQDLRLSRYNRRSGNDTGAKKAQDDAMMLFAAGLGLLFLAWNLAFYVPH